MLQHVNDSADITIPLPYVIDVDEGDNVEFRIARQEEARPTYELHIAPNGPLQLCINGFGKQQLLQLAKFIKDVAEKLE